MIRSWVCRISDVVPVNDSRDNVCAICRNLLTHVCGFVCTEKIHFIEYIRWCETIWLLLLMARKRTKTLFTNMPIGIISIIYSFSISGNPTTGDCPIVELDCNHTYHRHCFIKWVKRRAYCPLDNNIQIIPQTINRIKRKKLHGELVEMSQGMTYSKRMDEREKHSDYISQLNTDLKTVPLVIYRILKHNKLYYSYDEMYEIVCGKYTRPIDESIFAAAVDFNIDRGHIVKETFTVVTLNGATRQFDRFKYHKHEI